MELHKSAKYFCPYVRAHVRISIFRSILFCPPPPLSGLISFTPPGARAIFLHSKVLYNKIQFVKTLRGRDIIDSNYSFVSLILEANYRF